MNRREQQPGKGSVQGETLWRALGFRNERAFQRARQQGWSEIPLYPIPGQSRGLYARLDDLEAYLARKAAAVRGEGGGMV